MTSSTAPMTATGSQRWYMQAGYTVGGMNATAGQARQALHRRMADT